jgi:hypothetical protein
LIDCRFTVQHTDGVYPDAGEACAHVVDVWLFDNAHHSHYDVPRYNTLAYFPPFGPIEDADLVRLIVCAARLIVADGDPQKTVGNILAAEFDKSCSASGVM